MIENGLISNPTLIKNKKKITSQRGFLALSIIRHFDTTNSPKQIFRRSIWLFYHITQTHSLNHAMKRLALSTISRLFVDRFGRCFPKFDKKANIRVVRLKIADIGWVILNFKLFGRVFWSTLTLFLNYFILNKIIRIVYLQFEIVWSDSIKFCVFRTLWLYNFYSKFIFSKFLKIMI